MISKEELVCFDVSNPPHKMLGREKKIQEKYETFTKDKKNSKQFIAGIKEKLKETTYYFIENDFPYHIEPCIKHMICWYKNTDCQSVIKNIQSDYSILTYWENLSENRSIMEVNYIHIFITI